MKKFTLLTASLLIGAVAFALPPITYNFESDVAGTTAGTVMGIALAGANTATFGVVSFTDEQFPAPETSNCLKMYTGGITGVLDLSSFPANGIDATFTWKMYVTDITKESKVGFVFRANGTGGYSPGIMQGYFCTAWYRPGTGLGGRVYKSTSAAALTSLDGGYGSGTYYNTVVNNIPFWVKVTIAGTSPVTINSSFSLDGSTWSPMQSNIIDDGTKGGAAFSAGGVQLAYGLGNVDNAYVLDDITYTDNSNINWVKLPSRSTGIVISEEYYTLTGARIYNLNRESKGIYIVKQKMSDGSVKSSKVMLNK